MALWRGVAAPSVRNVTKFTNGLNYVSFVGCNTTTANLLLSKRLYILKKINKYTKIGTNVQLKLIKHRDL